MASRKRIYINIHSDTLVELDYYCKEKNASRSKLIEESIQKWLKEQYREEYYKEWSRPKKLIEDGLYMDVPF